MESVNKVIAWISDNWAAICSAIVILAAVAKSAKAFFSQSRDEQVRIAKSQLFEVALELCDRAEQKYKDLAKSGALKRSYVIGQIFEQYPILSKVTSQAEVISWIDLAIDTALDKLRAIIYETEQKNTAEKENAAKAVSEPHTDSEE